jgi:hypothetical protein
MEQDLRERVLKLAVVWVTAILKKNLQIVPEGLESVKVEVTDKVEEAKSKRRPRPHPFL